MNISSISDGSIVKIARQTKIVLGLLVPNTVFIVMLLIGVGLTLTAIVWGMWLTSLLTLLYFVFNPENKSNV